MLFSAQAGAETVPVGDRRDGISASLSVDDRGAVVRWRGLGPAAFAGADIAATINGRLLADPAREAYVDSGSRTLVLLLLDLSDPRREAQIVRDKLALIRIASRATAHQQVAIAVFADRPQLLVAEDHTIGTLVNMLATARPRAANVNLSQVLQDAMGVVAVGAAERRGIYVLTDGHSDDPLDADVLSERATRTGIALNFILAPSTRKVDMSALRRIASASGGLLIGEEQRESFVQAPFDLLDSGGSARFSLDDGRRYVWERTAEIKVEVRAEGGGLELVSEIPVPLAGIAETAAYIWQHHPAGTMASGAVVIALAGLAAAVVMPNRRRKQPERPVGERSVAVNPERPQPVDRETSSGPPHEVLWLKLRAQLRQRGALPLEHERMTPAEIGNHLHEQTGDVRVRSFVRSYYYPRRYGNEPGRLTDDEALSLVAALQAGQSRSDPARPPVEI